MQVWCKRYCTDPECRVHANADHLQIKNWNKVLLLCGNGLGKGVKKMTGLVYGLSGPKPVAAKTGALKAGTTKVSFKVQILKAILYRHFPSKEDLAAATMVRVAGSCPRSTASLPAIAVFYTLCARACDPVLCTCFEGLNRPLFNSSSGY
jgi:hypothetical protein